MTVKFNPTTVANRAVKSALDSGVTPQKLQQDGAKLIGKQLKLDGVFTGLSRVEAEKLKKAISTAVDQLAANTESRLNEERMSGVTA